MKTYKIKQNHKYREMKVIILIFSFLMMSCGGGGGGGGGSDEKQIVEEPKLEIHTNPTDGTFLTVTESDNTTIAYHGTRDQDGYPFSLNSITANDPEIEGDFLIALDNESRPAIFYTPDGAIFKLDYSSDAVERFSAISGSGALHVNVPVDLENAGSQVSDTGSTMGETSLMNKNVSEKTIESKQSNAPDVGGVETFEATASEHRIQLTKCGNPVENAQITVSVTPQIGTQNNYFTHHTGGGYYSFSVPTVQPTALEVLQEEICDSLQETISQVNDQCLAYKLLSVAYKDNEKKLCEKISRLVKNQDWAEMIDKDSITENCGTIRWLIDIACDDVFTSCDKGGLLYVEPNQSKYNLTIQIKVPEAETFVTDPVAFDPNTPSDFALELPNEIALSRIWTDPPNPMAHEWYTAKASFLCPDPEGTAVTMTVEGEGLGREGENKISTEKLIMETNDPKDLIIELDVPGIQGADGEITDIITVLGETYNVSRAVTSEAQGDTELKQWQMIVVRGADDSAVFDSDFDDDGYSGINSGGDDCNDNNASIHPGAAEVPNDGIDQDCDGQDATTEYVVWYTDNVRCWGAPWLYINEREQFNETEYRCNYPGGGIDCTQELVKTEIQGGFSTWKAASDWICPKVNGWHYHYWCTGGHYRVSGQELCFRLGSLGCDLSNVPEVPIPDPHPGM